MNFFFGWEEKTLEKRKKKKKKRKEIGVHGWHTRRLGGFKPGVVCFVTVFSFGNKRGEKKKEKGKKRMEKFRNLFSGLITDWISRNFVSVSGMGKRKLNN